MEQKFEQGFSEIIALHNDFAAAIKVVEHFIHTIDNTTLNDSRYALRAVVDCINSAINNNDGDFEKSHAIAMTALRIAWHDIVDIMYDEFKIYLDELSKKYGPDIVASHISIAECRKCIRKVQDLITQSREDRDKRVELYRDISLTDLQKMLELFRDCQDLEPSIAAQYKKERRNRLLAIAGICIGLTSASMLAYFNLRDDAPTPLQQTSTHNEVQQKT